jgi:prevent-host-death family protein
MSKSYTIADARHNLAAIVHELEQEPTIQLTRRGHPVAVLMSIQEHERLQAGLTTFTQAYQAFRASVDVAELSIDPSMFEDVRDESTGREFNW